MKRTVCLLWFIFCWALGTFILLYPTILSGGRMLIADNLDGRLILYLQEHWFRVFKGEASWLNLEMFFPIENSLGFSDSFFLFGLSHSLFRVLGLDIYAANFANLIFLCAVGYVGFWGQLRKGFGVSTAVASATAGLFICFSPVVSGAVLAHTQLLNSFYLPSVAWALAAGYRCFEDAPRRAFLLFAAAAVGMALVLWNAFYTGWFAVFYGCTVLALSMITLLIGGKLERKGLELRASVRLAPERFLCWLRFVLRHWKLFLLPLGVFALALLPFLRTYLPVLLVSGGHAYESARDQLPMLQDLLHVPLENWFWGGTMRSWLGDFAGRGESHFGFGFFTALAFLIAAGVVFRSRAQAVDSSARDPRRLLPLALLGVLVCWLLMLRLGDASLWAFVFKLVPGASAIRAVYRFNAVLSIPLLTVLAVAADLTWRRFGGRPNGIALVAATSLAGVFALLLCEQLMVREPSPYRFERDKVEARITAYPPVPDDAETFFLWPEDGRGNKASSLTLQMDAWAVAQRDNVPTINGFSGVFPAGHRLFQAAGAQDTQGYRMAVLSWLNQTDLTGKIYAFERTSSTWKIVSGDALDGWIDIYTYGTPLSGAATPPAGFLPLSLFAEAGWSNPEPEGTWTDGADATLLLPIKHRPNPGNQLILKMHATPFIPPSASGQRIHISINGREVVDTHWTKEHGRVPLFFEIDPSVPGDGELQLRISIHLPDATSPEEQGMSGDRRKLGLFVRSVEVFQQPE